MVAHNCHGKNKNLTAITKHLTAKPNTSRQKQNSFGFAVGIWFCREVFGFCCEVFGFAMRSLVLPWEFWFFGEVFCFCREVFVFAVRFSVLPWGILSLPWGFWFWREVFGFAVTVGATVMRSSPGPATIPQCSWFLTLGGIHVFFAMPKAKDKKNFYWLFICFLLGKTEFCMYNDLIQRTNDSIWIIHEAVVTKFRVYMLKTFLTHRWWMQSLHPCDCARNHSIPVLVISYPLPNSFIRS